MTYSCEKIAAHRPSASTLPGGKPAAVSAERYCATRPWRISAATSNTLNATTSQVERPSAASLRIWLRMRSLVARTKLISRKGRRSRKGLSTASASDTFIDVYQTTSPSRFASSSVSATAFAQIATPKMATRARPHFMRCRLTHRNVRRNERADRRKARRARAGGGVDPRLRREQVLQHGANPLRARVSGAHRHQVLLREIDLHQGFARRHAGEQRLDVHRQSRKCELVRRWRARVGLELRAHLRTRCLRQYAAHLRTPARRIDHAADQRRADLPGRRLRDTEELEVLARELEARGGVAGTQPHRRADGGDAAEPAARGRRKPGRPALGEAGHQAVEIFGRAGKADELRRRLQHALDSILRVGGAGDGDE